MDSNEWLKKEVNSWKSDGIINPSQAQAILAKYGLAKTPERVEVQKEKDHHGEFIKIVSIIGAILVGLGIIVFIASNWQRIPAFLKLFMLFGMTFATYLAGWKIEHNTHPKLGSALLLLGALFTGATIFLTAQIFHVKANVHWLLLLWFIAIAPLSYGFESRLILTLSLFVFGGWMGTYGKLDGAGAFLFYGLTLFGIGHLHEKTKFSDFKSIYQGFGLFFTLAVLYAGVVSELEILDNLGSHWLAYVFLITALTAVIASSFFLGRGVGKKQEFAWNLVAFLTAASLFILSLSTTTIKGPYYWPIIIIYHLVFFALVILTVLSGYYQKITTFINIGILFFVLYIGYFYFTTIFQYLPKSLALIIGGIILLGGGWYLEKKRRSIIEEIEG